MSTAVAIFAYNRVGHLSRTLGSLRANVEAASSPIYIYCDGAKGEGDRGQVRAVRDFVAGVAGFDDVTVVERPANLGLAASVTSGVGDVLSRHERVIVLEDDLLLSPHFLRYMNDGLACYDGDDRVASIHGYSYPVAGELPETFFLRGADCWGWATWRRAWSHFRPDGAALLAELRARRLASAFDLDGAYPFTRMLEDQVAGRNNSWAVRWHASCYLADRLTLYPGRSLVHNIGNDSSGTHCDTTDVFAQELARAQVDVSRIALEPSTSARAAFARFLRTRKGSLPARIGRLARRAVSLAR